MTPCATSGMWPMTCRGLDAVVTTEGSIVAPFERSFDAESVAMRVESWLMDVCDVSICCAVMGETLTASAAATIAAKRKAIMSMAQVFVFANLCRILPFTINPDKVYHHCV